MLVELSWLLVVLSNMTFVTPVLVTVKTRNPVKFGIRKESSRFA